jgi:hypothetical protein
MHLSKRPEERMLTYRDTKSIKEHATVADVEPERPTLPRRAGRACEAATRI